MLRKLIGPISLLVLFAWLSPVSAAKPDSSPNLPEVDGIYDVPGHPHLKLRVIVHKAKLPPVTVPTLVCELPDPDSAAVTPNYGYKLPSTGWTYYLNYQSVPGTISSANAVKLTDNAFKVWTDEVGSKAPIAYRGLTTETKAARNGKNIITWGRTSGSALGITYIWFNTTTHYITELDTIMNLKFVWYWSDPAGWPSNKSGYTCAYSGVYDAQDVMTHELGHWFGLDDVYDAAYSANTMFGYGGKGQTNADTLTAGDIAGINAIYYR